MRNCTTENEKEKKVGPIFHKEEHLYFSSKMSCFCYIK